MDDYYSSPLNNLLRGPSGGYARSAYEIERNPWSRRGEIEAALLFRGTIVSAFGYIETRLGELAVRCSRIDGYAALRESFPYSLEKRISFLRRVFSSEPLARHGQLANLFLDRFESAGELRHLVAHARMQVVPGWGVTFHDIPKSRAGALTIRSHRLSLQDLELRAWQGARLSRLCQHLLDRLDQEGVLAPE